MELNREQIIKALECCSLLYDDRDCTVCPKSDSKVCTVEVMRNALALINSQEQKIFELENRLKECENGYEETLYLDRCKLHDAEQKIKELTQANEQLSESYDHLEKTKDELLSERARLTEENERSRAEGEWISVEERLPDCEWGAESKAVLFITRQGTMYTGYYGCGGIYRDRYFREYKNATDGYDISFITHWMPLPEAPKIKGE